jgi:hypothetical protein
MNYNNKYLKYKNKYLQLINQIGGCELTIILKDMTTDLQLYKTIIEISIRNTVNDIICKLIEQNIIIYDKKLIKEYFYNYKFSIDNQPKIMSAPQGSLELHEFNTHPNSEIIFYINPKFINNIKSIEYIELKNNIVNNTIECIKFLDKFTKDELFNFIITSSKYADDDHNKTFLYYVARFGNIDILRYLVNKLGNSLMSKLLSIRCNDGRIVLFGAVDAVNNKKDIYLLIKSLTDPSLYKTKFWNTDGTWKNLKEWAEMRGVHKGFADDRFVYNDVSTIIS